MGVAEGVAGGVAALIPAAGAGERLGRGPKAFLPLGGRTLLEWAVAAFSPWADDVLVAVPPDHVQRARELVAGARVIAGGPSRQETVRRLLAATDAQWVLVHDAARPFLPRAVRDGVLRGAQDTGAATAAVALRDTVVDAASGQTVDRDRLRAVQTPQAFARDLLMEAHRVALDQGEHATDDTALVRSLGTAVRLVEGSPWLLKITTPADLDLAEAMQAVWREH